MLDLLALRPAQIAAFARWQRGRTARDWRCDGRSGATEGEVVYAEVVAWGFRPGSGDAIHRSALQIFLPALRRQPGLAGWYLVRTGVDAFLTVALFATGEDARRSREELTPLFRMHQGHLVESMERFAGEVEATADARGRSDEESPA